MPDTTDDIRQTIEEEYPGMNPREAELLTFDYIDNEGWNKGGIRNFKNHPDYVNYRDIREFHDYLADLDNADQDGILHIGSRFKGILDILEYSDDRIYIPSSKYCFIKCLEYLQPEIPKTDYFMLNPEGDNLTTLRKYCKNHGYIIPNIFRIKYVKNDEETIPKFRKINRQSSEIKTHIILLLDTDYHEYHAILIKLDNPDSRYSTNPKYMKTVYDHVMSNLKLGYIKTLSNEQRSLQTIKDKEVRTFCYVYDIETSSKEYLDKNNNVCREQIPEGTSYCKVNFKDDTIEPIKSIVGDKCLENMIEDICQNEPSLEPITIYAHNGGCFDHLYLKAATNIKFISQMKKGRVKRLDCLHINTNKKIILLDSFCFFQASLKDSCKYFKINDDKMDFDIVNKSHEWFVSNNEWIPYMEKDVEVLAKIIIKFEKYINTFGETMTNNCGISSIAWRIINKFSHGLQNTFRSKDYTTQAFITESRYGGRVLHYKKLYEGPGLISIDANSLFPSAMYLSEYPVDKFRVFDENIEVDSYMNYYLLNGIMNIVEVDIDATKRRYPLLPYRTDEGCIIYPATKFTGVYNSVDLLEAINDGYTITKVHRGIYWPTKKKIYDVIKALYEERKRLKNEGNPMEYVIKILLNSSYGYHGMYTNDTTIFSDHFDKHTAKRNGYVAAKELPNGQWEIVKKFFRPQCDKPVHLASFILAHSRRIMNQMIRLVGPENVYYSDTDSLYILASIIKDKNIPLNNDFGGFKNDYGDGVVITKAIFIDLKRYYLEFNKPNENGTTYKAKFNGLNFKDNKAIRNWIDKEDFNDANEEDIKKALIKFYTFFIDNPKTILSNDELKNQFQTIFQERWLRKHTQVIISQKELAFQVDPEVRNKWKGNESYPIGYDLRRTKNYAKLGPLTVPDKVDRFLYNLSRHKLNCSVLLGYNMEQKYITTSFKTSFALIGDKVYKCITNKDNITKFYGYDNFQTSTNHLPVFDINNNMIKYDCKYIICSNIQHPLQPILSKDELNMIIDIIKQYINKQNNSNKHVDSFNKKT